MALDVDRGQVLAHRIAAHQLAGVAVPASELAVLDLGVQDTPYGSAVQAVAARTSAPLEEGALEEGELEEGALVLAWSVRGAPHLHRRSDLPRLTTALWPLSEADATIRIANPQIRAGAELGLTAFTATARALREVVTGPMPKGEVSAGVSARVPEVLTYDCRSCKARHIYGGLFQQAGLAGGVRLVPGASPTTLAPVDGRPDVPAAAEGTGEFLEAYLRLHGPATLADAARYVGTTQTVLRGVWPADRLAEVRVDGRRAWLPQDAVEALRSAPAPRLVRLIPPSDPYLQARDRELLVPDRDRQRAVWRILGNPGALLVDGEVEGTWRARAAGRRRLDVTVTAFDALPARTRAAIDGEAARVAAVRGFPDVRVSYEEEE